jgi:hypothetical protein
MFAQEFNIGKIMTLCRVTSQHVIIITSFLEIISTQDLRLQVVLGLRVCFVASFNFLLIKTLRLCSLLVKYCIRLH